MWGVGAGGATVVFKVSEVFVVFVVSEVSVVVEGLEAQQPCGPRRRWRPRQCREFRRLHYHHPWWRLPRC